MKVKAWEDQLTPLEIAKLLESDQSLLFSIAPLLKSGQRPAGYIREEWGEDAHYFTAASDARNLLVVFTALRGNIGVSISTFLQCLRDDAYDVVLLRDRGDLHYTRGISGLGDALGIARRIEELAGTKRYQRVVTFGSSLGGLPALRFGRLLKASRAISVGGRTAWHPARLARGERPVDAFDLLCPCAPQSPTELVLVYSVGDEEDTLAFELVRKNFPECIGIPIDAEKHNLLGHFHKAHLLPLFLACLIDYWDAVDIRLDLLARLAQAAKQIPPKPSLREARAAQLAANAPNHRRSTHWSLSWPVKALQRAFRKGR